MLAPKVSEYLDANRGKHLEELKELLRIPSVSAQPKHAEDMTRGANWVAEALRRAGMARVEVMPTGGHPLVYAEWLNAPGKPTVLVYGHYDVQPPEPLELWTSPPFEPTERGGKLYARGATDDKGQIFAHIKGVEALMATEGALPVNVKFLIEGEEEVGSENLERFVRMHREMLRADVVAISDTAMWDEKTPAITYSLRGLVYYQVDVKGAKGDQHSGTFGGAIKNPIEALVELLDGMKDNKTGKITIPGFYDDVDVSSAERKALAKLPHSDRQYAKELGVKTLWGEQGWSTVERTTVRPTFEINGIWGGYTGAGAKTVLPAEAHAKVSMRLNPGQDPKKIMKLFERTVKERAHPSVQVSVHNLSGGWGAKVPLDHPAMRAGSRAVKAGFGKEPVYSAEGGSIPVVAMFQQVLGVPSILMGFGLHTENLHAPNEHFDIGNFHKGIRTSAAFFTALAQEDLSVTPKAAKKDPARKGAAKKKAPAKKMAGKKAKR
ncbi:MAG TPA: dipeptidase [Candidatus Thermoplasmatota archaeon]|nr:dipeptidase [Candidatus Thermoplasmatota archaeon]